MTLQELKTAIEEKSVNDDLVIFQYEDVPFVADQYILEISKIKNKSIQYIDSLDTLVSNSFDIFGMSETDDSIRVYKCNELENIPDKLRYEKHLYIVVNKLRDKDVKSRFDEFIVVIPKLEGWQLQDYVYSVAEGIDRKHLDWLISASNNDIYRLENELDKFRLFQETERKFLFNDMLHDGAFVDLSAFNVFNITNAVTTRDLETLKSALKEIKSFDAEPLGVVTLLYQGFKKLIQVWLALNATPESTGLKSNVIYVLNKQPRVYTKEQLISCFKLLTDVDRKLKTGTLCEMNYLIDYLICRILTY